MSAVCIKLDGKKIMCIEEERVQKDAVLTYFGLHLGIKFQRLKDQESASRESWHRGVSVQKRNGSSALGSYDRAS